MPASVGLRRDANDPGDPKLGRAFPVFSQLVVFRAAYALVLAKLIDRFTWLAEERIRWRSSAFFTSGFAG
jgi:hypothetical protein